MISLAKPARTMTSINSYTTQRDTIHRARVRRVDFSARSWLECNSSSQFDSLANTLRPRRFNAYVRHFRRFCSDFNALWAASMLLLGRFFRRLGFVASPA